MARGSSGFLSGCLSKLSFLYALLIVDVSAPVSISKIWYGSKDFKGSILLISNAVKYQTNQRATARASLKKNPYLIHDFR